ncbi:MAG: hypothetical protein H7Z75_20120 [Ferruginibacter sp.]|nr:hypothetical protein [Cytophagales bacterium]
MAYNKFSLMEVVEKFGLEIVDCQSVVEESKPYPSSDFLRTALKKGTPRALKIDTEKARSEFIVAPILLELQEIRKDEISFFSGIDFTVDRQQGLSGRCDFIISLDNEDRFLTAPVITIVEAKNDNVNSGLGQCIAEMLAAQIFNQKRGRNLEAIYGTVTTGTVWKFLKLQNKTVFVEELERAFSVEKNVDELLGILLKMLESKD